MIWTLNSSVLRPEATASVVRAYIQHRLYDEQPTQKLFMIGPMFRHERPQKGRFRQFHQIDVEIIGDPGPKSDAELIVVAMELLHRLDWADAAVQPTGWTPPAAIPIMVQSAAGPQQEMVFNVSYRITNDADPNLRLVDVRVTWTEMNAPPGAPPRRYAMSTIRHDDP